MVLESTNGNVEKHLIVYWIARLKESSNCCGVPGFVWPKISHWTHLKHAWILFKPNRSQALLVWMLANTYRLCREIQIFLDHFSTKNWRVMDRGSEKRMRGRQKNVSWIKWDISKWRMRIIRVAVVKQILSVTVCNSSGLVSF